MSTRSTVSAARQLIEEGEIKPVALAMPSDGLWGDGSGYLPHHGYAYDRWFWMTCQPL